MTSLSSVILGLVVMTSLALLIVIFDAIFWSIAVVLGTKEHPAWRVPFIVFLGISGCIGGYAIHIIVTGKLINVLDILFSFSPF